MGLDTSSVSSPLYHFSSTFQLGDLANANPAPYVQKTPLYVRSGSYIKQMSLEHLSYIKQKPLEHLSYIKEASWNTSGRT